MMIRKIFICYFSTLVGNEHYVSCPAIYQFLYKKFSLLLLIVILKIEILHFFSFYQFPFFFLQFYAPFVKIFVGGGGGITRERGTTPPLNMPLVMVSSAPGLSMLSPLSFNQICWQGSFPLWIRWKGFWRKPGNLRVRKNFIYITLY